MKKNLMILVLIIFTLMVGINSVKAEQFITTDWSHTIGAKTWDAAGDQTLNEKSWNMTGTTAGTPTFGYEADRGQQFGSKNNPYSSVTLSSSAFTGTVTTVKVSTAGAADVAATVSVSVGGVVFKNGDDTSVEITSSNTEYTFTGSASGTINIVWTQTSSKALYVKALAVTTKTSSGTVEIANNISHKAAQAAVVEFAQYVNTRMNGTNVCTGTGAQLSTEWGNIKAKYNALFGTGTSLDETELAWAKDLLKNATAKWDGSHDNDQYYCLERAMKTYEFCVANRGCEDFMSEVRTVAKMKPFGGLLDIFDVTNNSSALIIVIVSILSASAVGGYFFLRRRKHQ